MSLKILVKKREVNSSSFELSIQWVLDADHCNGLLIQRVARNDTKLQSIGNVTRDLCIYWEAWTVLNYQVYGVSPVDNKLMLLPSQSYHDTFAGPASGVGATRIIGTVYWIDKSCTDYMTVLSRMPAGQVPYAAFLYSTFADPFNGLSPALLLERDEFFLYEVF